MSKQRQPSAGDRPAAEKSLEAVAEKAAGERSQGKITLPSSGLAEEILELLEQQQARAAAAEEVSMAWVAFGLGGTSFALPVESVREVVRIESITRVPHTAQAVAGLTTVWGQPVPVIDLRRRIGIEASALDSDSRLLVTSGNRPLGLLVDRVEQVFRVLPSRVAPTPRELPGTAGELATGSFDPGSRRSVLLDLASILRFQRTTAGPGNAAARSQEAS